jgi:hypothetical protein
MDRSKLGAREKDMAHFPKLLRNLPPFDGPFDAFKLEAKRLRRHPRRAYPDRAKAMHAARFEVGTSEIEFWFHAPSRT